MGTVARLFRHPIKSIGVEPLETIELRAGRTVAGDRAWAVAHEAASAETGWIPCANFVRGAKSPRLMAVSAATDPTTGHLTLRHPDLSPLTADPATEGARIVDWVRPICDPGRAAPAELRPATDQGMTDSPFPSISILNLSSLRALEGRTGRAMDPRRFRGNIWLDGLGPWEEFEWIGRDLVIGTARLRVEERITRCTATHVDPETGRSDTDTLGALETGWGHRDFGVYAIVTEGGRVALGDAAMPA